MIILTSMPEAERHAKHAACKCRMIASHYAIETQKVLAKPEDEACKGRYAAVQATYRSALWTQALAEEARDTMEELAKTEERARTLRLRVEALDAELVAAIEDTAVSMHTYERMHV